MGAKRKNRLIRWIEYLTFLGVRMVLRLLGSAGTRRLGKILGRVFSLIPGRRDRLTRRNLSRSFPEKPKEWVDETARECWIHFATQILQYVRTIDSPLNAMLERAEVSGAEPIREATERGQGVVLYTAHFGNWETAVSLLSILGTEFAVVARPLDNPLLQKVIERGRRRSGVEVLPRRRAASQMREWVASGRGVVVLPDQSVRPHEGVLSDFVGRPAWTTTAPVRLAIRSGALLVGAFCFADQQGHVRAVVTDPVDTSRIEPSREQIQRLTDMMNENISRTIREHPELWLWMHDRWKGAPGEDPA